MYQTEEIVQEIKTAAKRRKVLLILIPILFVGIGITAAYMIEPTYKSSTSILVQKDETLNPLVMYDMAVNMASENRLESFNQIIYSRSTIEMLIDSLNLDKDAKSEKERQALIEKIPNNIETVSRASDSFEISYFDEDPVLARNAVKLLSDHFIDTRLRIENQRNKETVDFFNDKLKEIKSIVDQKSEQVTSASTEQLRQLPSEVSGLQSRLRDINSKLETLDWQILQREKDLEIIRNFQESGGEGDAIPELYKLPLEEMTIGEELETMLNEYDQLSQQYTESYPRVQTLTQQITQIAGRIPALIESKLNDLNMQRSNLTQNKGQVIADMQRSYIANQRINSQRSDYSIYEGLHNDMKVKLEQAKITQDIGSRSAEQFIVIDAPYVPENPASPNKRLIISVSLLLGLVMGVIASAIAEAMDSTIREEEDLPVSKPVIAYLTSG